MVELLGTAIGIMSVFVMIGVMLPFIQADFDSPEILNQTDDFEDEISQGSGELNAVSALGIVKSVLKMFWWTYGDLPFWLDIIFVIFRIALVLILIQYLPFVG